MLCVVSYPRYLLDFVISYRSVVCYVGVSRTVVQRLTYLLIVEICYR